MAVYARFVGEQGEFSAFDLSIVPAGEAGRFSVLRDGKRILALQLSKDTVSGLSFDNGFDEEAVGFALSSLGRLSSSRRLKVDIDLSRESTARLRLHKLERPKAGSFRQVLSLLREWFPALMAGASVLKRRILPDAYLVQGACGPHTMRARLRASRERAALLSQTMFDSPAKTISLSKSAHTVDIEVVQHPGSKEMGGDMVLPSAVRAVLDIPDSLEKYEKGLAYTASSDINKVKKSGFECAISRDQEDFLLFYKSIYLPYLAARHKGNAVEVPFDELERLFKKGFLLIVQKEGSVLGAVLAYECGNRLVLKALGTMEGDLSLVKSGVVSAIYYYSIKHAFESGFSILDLGLGGPFRSSGLAFYKEKWNARFVTDSGADVISLRFADQKLRQAFLSRKRPFLAGELPMERPAH